MRIRSAYHIDFTATNLGGLQVKIWVGNLSGTPTYEQTVRAINSRVSVDIAELVKSLVPKDGITQTRVRYKVDAFTNNSPGIFFKTWQKEYVARFGYNLFWQSAQVDSELLTTNQFDSFNVSEGTITETDSLNPYSETSATKFETVSNQIQFSRSVPSGLINFSNFYFFEEGTHTIYIEFSNTSYIEFDLTVSAISGNQIQVIDLLNADVKVRQAGTYFSDNLEQYTFIESFGNSDGVLNVRINTDECILYSPSVQRYFDAEGIDQALQQTNQKFFWKKGEPLQFAYLLNSTKKIVSNNPITFNLKNGSSEALIDLSLFATQPSSAEVDNVQINISGGDDIIIPVQYIPCTKQPITKVDFINKLGIRQTIWFYGSKRIINPNENESYKSNILVNGGYDVTNHQFKNYNAQAKQKVVLNTGYYTEDFNAVFEELFLSERIWLDDLPAQIESKTFEKRTKLNDDLINYEITFEYANDYISNVR